MKHGELVNLAKYWLLLAKQCNPVFTEKGTAKSKEMPDAIGWNSAGSIVVECKTSLADFRADSKKQFRRGPGTGMGKLRYYLFTHELYLQIPEDELPDGWGIVVVNAGGRVRQVMHKHSKLWGCDIWAELYYLRNRILEVQKFGH